MERMSIGHFAKVTGLSSKALRWYDEIGLLKPAEVDPFSGYRYYAPTQVESATLVARLRTIGMPLAVITRLLPQSAAAQAAAIQSYWRQSEADHASLRSHVTTLVAHLREEESDMFITTNTLTAAARSGIGQRDLMCDAVLCGTHLFAIADGFGTDPAAASDVLAKLAAYDDLPDAIDPVRLLDEAVAKAAATLTERPDSGCTLTAVITGEEQAAVAHVGDSRLYRIRAGEVERLTHDHTLVQSQVDAGRLTTEEAREHPERSLLNRALAAGQPNQPDIALVATRPGDRLVLTTKGVHNQMAPAQLAALVGQGTPEECVAAVAERVAEGPDNFAIVVVDLP